MQKLFLLLFSLCILAVILLLAPLSIKAEDSWPLNQKQTQSLLDITRKFPLTEAQWEFFDASLYYPNSSYPRKTGAIALTKQTILKKQLNYWFKKKPLELSKSFIKTTFKLIPLISSGGVSTIIGLAEKYTVNKATEYATDWLLQNEIRVGTGNGDYAFISYLNNWQQITIPFIIVYNPKNQNVAIEFYSVSPIEPPLGRGGLATNIDWPNATCWPHDRWLINEKKRNNDNRIEPFVIRIKGLVEENKDGLFRWKEKPSIEVDFNNPVPEIKQGDIVWKNETIRQLSFIKNKIISPAMQKMEKLKEKIINTKELADKITTTIKDLFRGIDSEAQIGTQLVIAKKIETPEPEKKPTPEPEKPQVVTEPEFKKEPNEKPVIIEPKLIVELEPKLEEPELEPEPMEIIEPIPEIIPKPKKTIIKKPETIEIQPCSLRKNQSPTKNTIIFNELAWMGTKNSSNDEWLELKNISQQGIDLTNWQIIDKQNQIEIIIENFFLQQNDFMLLERTDESSAVPQSDLIYKGNLNNTEEVIYLFDNNCVLQDKIEANPYWPKGDNSTKKTMERKDDLTWQTSKPIGGTPKEKNSIPDIIITGGGSSPNPTPEEEIATQEETETPQPLNIIITEIQIGTGSSSKEDFIEIYNLATSTADISGLKLKKKSSTGKEYSIRSFPEGSIVQGEGYFLWTNSEYKSLEADSTSTQTIAKNNSIALLDKDNNILSQVAFGESENPFVENTAFLVNPNNNQTIGRKTKGEYQNTNNNSEDFELQFPTPKKDNQTFITLATTSEEGLPFIYSLTASPSPERKTIDLFWLATTSKQYIIKYSEEKITEENWNEAIILENLITPKTQTIEHFKISDLSPKTDYFFSIKFINQGVTSSVSNLARARPWPGFKDNEDGTITDLYTNLTWPKNAKSTASNEGATNTQAESIEYANTTSSLAGYEDWRLPSFKELYSIITYPFLNLEDKYWTSDKYQTFHGNPNQYKSWYVNFLTKEIAPESYIWDDSPAYYFVPTKGDEMPASTATAEINLIDNNNGTVTDPVTNLMWANFQFALTKEEKLTWDKAMKFAFNRVLCNNNIFQGTYKKLGDCQEHNGIKYNDWRLPNIQEITRLTKMGPSSALPWLGGRSYFYWSLNTFNDEQAWRIGNGYLVGELAPHNKTSQLNVQIVRNIY